MFEQAAGDRGEGNRSAVITYTAANCGWQVTVKGFTLALRHHHRRLTQLRRGHRRCCDPDCLC